MLPFLFTALKVGTTLAFIGAIVGEYFGGTRYVLGRVVLTSMSTGSFDAGVGGHRHRGQPCDRLRICVVSLAERLRHPVVLGTPGRRDRDRVIAPQQVSTHCRVVRYRAPDTSGTPRTEGVGGDPGTQHDREREVST